MTIITDKVIVPNGTDFTFVCKKIPFAISCLSDMPHKDANLVDLDLINKMGIPLRNIKVTRMCLLGHDVRAVGRIKQTIQCVSKGRVQGTIHLEAKVVRDLYTTLGADCIPSARTYAKLMGKEPPNHQDDDPEEEDNKTPIVHLGGADESDVTLAEDEENREKDNNIQENAVHNQEHDDSDWPWPNSDDELTEQEYNMLKDPFFVKDQPYRNQSMTSTQNYELPKLLKNVIRDHSFNPLKLPDYSDYYSEPYKSICYAHTGKKPKSAFLERWGRERRYFRPTVTGNDVCHDVMMS